MNARIAVEVALQNARDTYRALLSLYVDPDDEAAVAETPVPAPISGALASARATVESLMNALDYGELPVEA